MKPYEYIALHGTDLFTRNEGKTINVRLLSDDGLIYQGHFAGITPIGNNLPLIDGLLIEQPQFVIHFFYNDPENGCVVPVKVNILLIDSMDDISFEQTWQLFNYSLYLFIKIIKLKKVKHEQ